MRKFVSREVEEVFQSQDEPFRKRLFELSKNCPPTWPIEESLKWGEASYVPSKSRTGSPLRIARHDEAHVAVYFNCNTLLVEQFRTRFADELEYSGNRAIVLGVEDELPNEILRDCVRDALTYHWRNRHD